MTTLYRPAMFNVRAGTISSLATVSFENESGTTCNGPGRDDSVEDAVKEATAGADLEIYTGRHRGLVTKLIAAERVDSLSKRRPLLQHAGM